MVDRVQEIFFGERFKDGTVRTLRDIVVHGCACVLEVDLFKNTPASAPTLTYLRVQRGFQNSQIYLEAAMK
jgi:hypothetical protein